LELQTKLLRVLEDGQLVRLGSPKLVTLDVRVIVATNRDLAQRVKQGMFREDLYYRLNVFPIHVPPLRERTEDIPPLVWSFVREFERKMGKQIESIPKSTMEILQRHAWPGNIRELRHLIEQAVILMVGGHLTIDMPASSVNGLASSFEEVEKQHILSVLDQTRWRVKGLGGAAEMLGTRPTTLYTKMKRLGIPARQDKYGPPYFIGIAPPFRQQPPQHANPCLKTGFLRFP
jgi:formate hydrogenlyase transcriptional activator